MSLTKKLQVSEFFYSLQGEGRSMGMPSVFIRLTGCNLLCGGMKTDKDKKLHDGATWRCDTIEVWKKGKAYTYEELINKMVEEIDFINKLEQGSHLIFTGGEPLLQQEDIIGFLLYLRRHFILMPCVEIETNGTIMPMFELNVKVSYWNVSPKLLSSGMPSKRTTFADIIQVFNALPTTIFKYVITSLEDVKHIDELVANGFMIKTKVWLMPAASNRDELYLRNEHVAAYALSKGYNFCTRLQIEIWNQTTGV